MRDRRHRLLGLGTLAMFVLAGCSSLANLNIPTPPPGSGGAIGGDSTTVVSNLTGVALPSVPSVPPTSVAIAPGKSTLTGLVTGPAGPAGGATVEVDRVVGAASASKTVTAQADGTWKVANIIGGLYRVRAWQAPTLDLITPQFVLLGAGATQNVMLSLMSYNGQSITATVTPSPPVVGQVATLAVQVVQETVGSDGVVRAAPLPGAMVTVIAAGNVVLVGANPGTTGSSGQLDLNLDCSSVGPVGLSATVNGQSSFPLGVPDCSEPIATVTIPTTVTTTPLPSTSVP